MRISDEELEKAIPNGIYHIGSDHKPTDPKERTFIVSTGRGGVINVVKSLRKNIEEALKTK